TRIHQHAPRPGILTSPGSLGVRQIVARMPHGIFSRHFRHGRTWYIRYTVGGRLVREKDRRRAGWVYPRACQDRAPESARRHRSREVPAAEGPQAGPRPRARGSLPRARRGAPAGLPPDPLHTRAARDRIRRDRPRRSLGLPHRQVKLARRKVVAAATVNRELNVLKAMLAQAVTWKLLDVNPARDVRGFKVQNARLRYLEP